MDEYKADIEHSIQNNNNQEDGMKVKLCSGCETQIKDRFIFHAMDQYWHNECLKCSCCNTKLADVGTTCFSKGGMVLCKQDYIKMFGQCGQCAACSRQIPAAEFVMKAGRNRTYHVACFQCSTCRQRLVPGDRFAITDIGLVCEKDYPRAMARQQHQQQQSIRPINRVC